MLRLLFIGRVDIARAPLVQIIEASTPLSAAPLTASCVASAFVTGDAVESCGDTKQCKTQQRHHSSDGNRGSVVADARGKLE